MGVSSSSNADDMDFPNKEPWKSFEGCFFFFSSTDATFRDKVRWLLSMILSQMWSSILPKKKTIPADPKKKQFTFKLLTLNYNIWWHIRCTFFY